MIYTVQVFDGTNGHVLIEPTNRVHLPKTDDLVDIGDTTWRVYEVRWHIRSDTFNVIVFPIGGGAYA